MIWPFKKKEECPTSWDLQQAYDFAPFTPDIVTLQQKETQLLFVWDEMQQRMPEFRLIEEYSVPVGAAFTKDMFVMYKRKLGLDSYAVALDESFFQAQRRIIKGELHAIKSMRYMELDTVYQNGVEFERRRVTVLMPYNYIGKNVKTGEPYKGYWMASIRCWMYVGVQEHWQKMMDEGEGFFLYERVREFIPKNPDLSPYYYFSKLEYDDF